MVGKATDQWNAGSAAFTPESERKESVNNLFDCLTFLKGRSSKIRLVSSWANLIL
jgi:hypothetical protein